jgi:hypothetical protein
VIIHRGAMKMAEDRLEVTHLLGKKLDEPIIIECGSKTENKNKMEAVAKLFNKKLDEEFIIVVHQVKYVALFSYDGLEIFDTYYDCWMIDYENLWGLLTGKVMIVDE